MNARALRACAPAEGPFFARLERGGHSILADRCASGGAIGARAQHGTRRRRRRAVFTAARVLRGGGRAHGPFKPRRSASCDRVAPPRLQPPSQPGAAFALPQACSGKSGRDSPEYGRRFVLTPLGNAPAPSTLHDAPRAQLLTLSFPWPRPREELADRRVTCHSESPSHRE